MYSNLTGNNIEKGGSKRYIDDMHRQKYTIMSSYYYKYKS